MSKVKKYVPTAAIVILYNPSENVVNKWKHLQEEDTNTCYLFVDNTPSHLANPNSNALTNYIPIGKNIGIAAAQNIGIRKAKEQSAEKIIFFDQDSNPAPEMIRKLESFFEYHKKDRKLAAVGPRIKDQGNHCPISNHESESFSPESIISSGMLTSMEVIEDVGGLEESLFIDWVDHEWCYRARSKGYDILQANDITMNHHIGESSIICFGCHLHKTSPIRYFYSFRNKRRLLCRNYIPQHRKFYIIRGMLVFLCLVPLCKDFKGQKLKSLSMALKGLLSK